MPAEKSKTDWEKNRVNPNPFNFDVNNIGTCTCSVPLNENMSERLSKYNSSSCVLVGAQIITHFCAGKKFVSLLQKRYETRTRKKAMIIFSSHLNFISLKGYGYYLLYTEPPVLSCSLGFKSDHAIILIVAFVVLRKV